MTSTDQHARLDAERHQLRQASQRLLAGAPQRSTGALTASTLATEAGLPRHRLYEHHADLLAEFQSAAGGGPIPPPLAALQQQLTTAQARIHQLETTEAELQGKIKTLRALIVELTHEAHTNNIRPLLPQGHGRLGLSGR